MRYKTYRIAFLFLLALATSACQLLDRLAPSPAEQEVVVLPTLTPEGNEENEADAASESEDPIAQEEPSPVPTAEVDADAPPPLPATVPPKADGESGDGDDFDLFESPAGYRFQHPASWNVADFFGQTIATNDPIVLETGELTGDQLLLLFVAGPTEADGQSAEQLLMTVQEDVLASYLADGSLTPLSAAEPLAQGSATGVQATYQLVSNSGEDLSIQAVSLIKQDLYVVMMALQPDTEQTAVSDWLEQTMKSLELVSGEYLVNADTYGLTQEELETLEQELIEPDQAP